ncbi:uncharacterized protein [Chelonus insularis]|uniref:uncharacterized protein n=1 Tax=Chelonus insularis TaxID=460826 RepID=UPI00158B8C13|nr:uncharacterized protein LOC118064585 [Chelonus insularis]
MYKFLSFCLLGIVLAFAVVTSAEKRTLSLQTLLITAHKICLQKEESAKQELLGRNEMDDMTESDIHRCHHACVWENSGLFSNNTFDLENMIPTPHELPHRIKRIFFRTILYTCVGHSYEIEDECEKASTFMRCIITLAQHKPLQIQKK